ncbi:unnamed protein product [Rhizoctonia solani]|uniref:Jacalin-type lectin domain-containing protein n=1 Tax=Rhizoctonia solani TaxID=456999 RepID=A0A8H3DQD0_9AGAM|nr:unnamed protein product [Rhizoctonia solani]
MFNLDTNADMDSYQRDQVARHSNIQQVQGIHKFDFIAQTWGAQVVDFIHANSIGNAVIVFGNTNSLYSRAGDSIRLFAAQNGLIDAWVQAIGGNTPTSGANSAACPQGVPPNIGCEVADKILYRGSPIINLKSSGFFYDASIFVSPEGQPLTRRSPIRVEFEYTLKDGMRQSNLYGGPHGTWFNDLPLIPSSPKLSIITLHGRDRLYGLTLTLTSGQAFTHGGSGGDSYSLVLSADEYVTSVKLCWAKKKGHTRIFYVQATANTGRMVMVGDTTENCATVTGPSGHGVVGAYGRNGTEMDQLGFIYARY